MPERSALGRTHFLWLELLEPHGALRSRNFYWLSSERDIVDQAKANWYMAPQSAFASFHALSALPGATVTLERLDDFESTPASLHFRLRNSGTTLAFFTRLRALRADAAELLPAYFSDNFVSLLPGEAVELSVRWPSCGPSLARIEASAPNMKTAYLSP